MRGRGAAWRGEPGSARAAALVVAVALGCGAQRAAPVEVAPADASRDPLAPLLSALPVGASSCVAVRAARVVDRRRALAATLSRAGALGWARVPHVRAYVRCDAGENDARTELLAIDDLDLEDRSAVAEALALSVRWDGEPCVHDECAWPVARVLGPGVLALVRRAAEGVAGPGVERVLVRLARAWPDAVELAVDGDDARIVSPDAAGLTVARVGVGPGLERGAALGTAEDAFTWEELELAVEDRRIAEARASAAADARILADVADAPAWSAERLQQQLTARLARARRASGRTTEADRDALGTLARLALDHGPADLAIVAEAARALALVGRATEALAVVDRLALAAAGDDVRAGALTALGRELALAARAPSLAARLVAAGLGADARAADRVADVLASLCESGVPYADAETLVRAATRALDPAPALVPVEPEVEIGRRALAACLWLALGAREDIVDVEIWLRGSAVSPPAARTSPGLRVVPLEDGVYVAATGRASERLLGLAEIVEAALLGAAPGASLELSLLGHEARGDVRGGLHGRVGSGGPVVLDGASPPLAALAPQRLAVVIAAPLEALFRRRFPAPVLEWTVASDDPRPEVFEAALRRAGVAGCAVTETAVRCVPGPRGAADGLSAIVAVAEVFGALE